MLRHVRAAMVVALVVTGACKKEQTGPGVVTPGEGTVAVQAPRSGMVARPAPFDLTKVSVPELFAHVPADTPYVLGSFEAFPLAYFGKIKTAIAPVLERRLDELSDEKGGDLRWFLEVLEEEMGGTWSAEGLSRIGVSATPRFALYGLGLLPVVLRVELADHRKVLATLERIARKVNEPLPPRRSHRGHEHWRIPLGGIEVLVGLTDNQLIVALGPSDRIEASIGLILGTEKPRESMADGKALANAANKHGLGPHLIGFADMRRITRRLMADHGATLGRACATAVERLSSRVPRALIGYSPLSGGVWSGGMVVELAPDLVQELRALEVELPSLDGVITPTSMFAMAMGIDLERGRQLAVRGVQALGEVVESCEDAEELEELEELESTLARPLPPMFAAITSVGVAIESLVFDSPSDTLPAQVEAVVFATSKDARALFSQLDQVAPLGDYGVVADGLLRPLSGLPLPFPLHAGVGERALVVAVGGETSKGLAHKVLAAQPAGPSPFLIMSYDSARFSEIESRLDRLTEDDDEEDEEDEDTKEFKNELGRRLDSIYGQGIVTLEVSDHGLVFWGSVEVK